MFRLKASLINFLWSYWVCPHSAIQLQKLVAVTSGQEWVGINALMKMLSTLDACSNQEPKRHTKGVMGRVGHFGS